MSSKLWPLCIKLIHPNTSQAINLYLRYEKSSLREQVTIYSILIALSGTKGKERKRIGRMQG
jgi:hypothetical protein